MPSPQISIRLDPDFERELLDFATDFGLSRQEVIRRAVHQLHERSGGRGTKLVDDLVATYGLGAEITFALDVAGGISATVQPGSAPDGYALDAAGTERPLEAMVLIERKDAGGRATVELVDIMPADDGRAPARVFVATVPAQPYEFTVRLDALYPTA